jgi:hypothetical protein
MTSPSADNERVDAIRALVEGRVEEWQGLPDGCQHEDFAQVLDGGEEEGTAMVSGNRAQFRMYRAPDQPDPIQVWFNHEGSAFLITFTDPKLSDEVEAVLQRLGQPEAKLDPSIGYHADATQWVYARRGLTLYVREHVNEVARLSAYMPTSPNYYEQYLGARDQRRYF